MTKTVEMQAEQRKLKNELDKLLPKDRTMTTQPFTLVSVGHDTIESSLPDELTSEESDAFLNYLSDQSWTAFDCWDQLHDMIFDYYKDFKAQKAKVTP